ncbi:MAG: phosphotransferase [Clostridiales bacterium]|nr:phosphotransferase [Clostridiales bacterium]
MYYKVEQVLEKQLAMTEKFYKGRGILICETDHGLFALKEFHGQEKKAAYLYQLGAFLTEHHISCDYILKNREDALITEGVDGTKYTFHHWVRGRECDVRSRMDMVMAVSFLAGFHAACEGEAVRERIFFAGEGAAQMGYQPETAYEKYLRRDRELRKIKKYIASRKSKSAFELLYLQCFSEYICQSEDVLDFLEEQKDIFERHTMGACHGDFNQHNVVMDSAGMTLIHMERAGYDAQVSDLGNFLRKCLEKHEWSETLGLEMLREYSRVHALNEADWVELYGRLSYPEKFWKIANRYYYSNKVLDAGKNYEKLKKELRQNEARKSFLAVLRRARL